MSRIADKIRAYVNDPTVAEHYGAWGILRHDQRRLIRELCDTCDMFEKTADELARKQSENVIELPCNIGDSCYPLPRYRKPIVERKVSRITFSKRNVIIGYYENDGQYRPPLRTRVLGEDVFLTKAEAEAKMKGGAE